MSEFTIKDGSEYVSYSTQQEVTNYSYTGSYTLQVNVLIERWTYSETCQRPKDL